MPRILVTGATGFIGNYVVRELLCRNIEVIATSRDKEKAEKFGVQGFIYKNEAFLVYLRTALDELIEKAKKKNVLRKFFC